MRAAKWLLVVTLGCGGGSKAATTPEPAPTQPAPADEQAQRDREAAAKAEADAAQAVREAAEAKAMVERLMVDLEDLTKKIDGAIQMVVDAQNDADRKAASDRLKQLQKEQAEMKQRAAAARAAAERAERKKGSQISKECQDNPLAKGCS